MPFRSRTDLTGYTGTVRLADIITRGPWHDVRAYGATGDGVTDDFAAITAAKAAAAGNNGVVYVPPGTFRITAPLDLKATRSRMVGAGRNVSIIRQDTPNTPIVQLGGYESYLGKLSLHYNAAQPLANTDANAIEIYALAWSVIEEINIQKPYRGFHVKQQAVEGGANWIFSTTVRDIIISEFSGIGVEMIPFAGGISGNILDNIYMSYDIGGGPQDVIAGLDLRSWDNGSLRQINVESCNPTGAPINLASCNGILLDAIHFEQLFPKGNYQGFIYFDGTKASARNVSVRLCSILVGNVANEYAIFRINNGSVVDVEGVFVEGNTVTTPNFREWLVAGTLSGVEIRRAGVVAPDLTGLGYFSIPGAVHREREMITVDVTAAAQTGTLGELPANAYVTDVRIQVITAFDSDGTDDITVGWDTDVDALATATDVSTTGIKTPTLGVSAGNNGTAQTVKAYYTNGGSEPTTGVAKILVEFYRLDL